MVLVNSISPPFNLYFMKNLFFIFLISLAFMGRCNKEDKVASIPPSGLEIKDSVLVQNLSHVWEITWGPDNFVWMTERGGRVSRVNPATGAVLPLLTISEVVSNGE